MKKWSRKLKLAKETLRQLESESLENVFGAATGKTVCGTYCITNCPVSVCQTVCPACG